MEIETKSRSDVNCTSLCESRGIASQNCSQECTSSYYNMTQEALQTEIKKLTHTPKLNATQETEKRPSPDGDDTGTMPGLWRRGVFVLQIGENVWMPSGPVQTMNVTRTCEKGMALEDNGACVPCPAGTYLSNSSVCELCPVGQFQPLTMQVTCLPCNDATNATGSTNCTDPVTTPTTTTTTMTTPTSATTTPTTTMTTPTSTTTTPTTTTTTPTSTTTATQRTTTVPRKQIFIHIDWDNFDAD